MAYLVVKRFELYLYRFLIPSGYPTLGSFIFCWDTRGCFPYPQLMLRNIKNKKDRQNSRQKATHHTTNHKPSSQSKNRTRCPCSSRAKTSPGCLWKKLLQCRFAWRLVGEAIKFRKQIVYKHLIRRNPVLIVWRYSSTL